MRFVRLVGLAVLAAAVAALLPASNSRAAALAVAADDRQPIPTDAEIMKALATIKDTYKTEYAKTKVADRAALA
jgi:hypothetical protein